MANEDCINPSLNASSEGILSGVLLAESIQLKTNAAFSGNVQLKGLNLVSLEPHSPRLSVSPVKIEKLSMLQARTSVRAVSSVLEKDRLRVNVRLQSESVFLVSNVQGAVAGLAFLQPATITYKVDVNTNESFSKKLLLAHSIAVKSSATAEEITSVISYSEGLDIAPKLVTSSPQLIVTYSLPTLDKSCQAVCDVRRVQLRNSIALFGQIDSVLSFKNVAIAGSSLLVEPLATFLTVTAQNLTGRVFVDLLPIHAKSNCINNVDIVINKTVVLANSSNLAVYGAFTSNIALSDLNLINALNSEVLLISKVFDSQLQVPFEPVTSTGSLGVIGNLSINSLNLGLADAAFSLNVIPIEPDRNVNIGLAVSSSSSLAFASRIILNQLVLPNSSAVFRLSASIDSSSILVYRQISLQAAPCIARSQTTSYFSTNTADISYPISIHDQVKYPIATATSFASPTLNDAPVYFAHGAFGAAVVSVNTPGQLESSLSASMRAAVCINQGETYSSALRGKSTIVLLRLSAIDTSTVRRFTMGNSAIGPDVTRDVGNNWLAGYSGSLDDTSTGGNSTLATGLIYSDSRPLSIGGSFGVTPVSGMLLIANSLIRHNFNTADATTQPISVVTQFKCPITASTRFTKTRVETTTNPNDDVGLAPTYSTTHMAYLSNSQLSSLNVSNSFFEYKAGMREAVNTATTQHIHSSDSMFSVLPIKAGVKHQFRKHYVIQSGTYTVFSAGFRQGSGVPQKYCVTLLDSNEELVDVSPYSNITPGQYQLRLRIGSYRGINSNRSVDVDIPITGIHNQEFVIDSSYRWFIDVSKPGGIFHSNAKLRITQDTGATSTNVGNAVLLVTRPNVSNASLPVSEQAGGDQGESNQALLSNPGERNLLIGEFSIGISRPDSSQESNVQVSVASSNAITTYTQNSSNLPAASVSSFSPALIQLIVDEEGILKGRVKNSSLPDNTTDNIDAILPAAVKNYIAAGGKFSKVLVGQNAIGALTVPVTGQTTGRQLFVWGSNIYGHLVPPSSEDYNTFIKDGYIENVLDFDIAASYMCIIKDDGIIKCWGCQDSFNARNTLKSCWVDSNNSDVSVLDGAIGGQHMVLKWKDANSVQLRQYGLIANLPHLDGWSTASEGSIACGLEHVAAIRADETVVCWGSNTAGQCTVPVGLTDVKQVVCGDYHTVALKGDGTVVAWGDNTFGQLNIASISGLKAKSIFAGGKYSGALRLGSSTDIAPTDANYSDVEDTAIVTGDSSNYITHVPLCEGKSYDPTYPRYRMKFHRVVGGWDHAIGVRKVESNRASIIHPELSRIVNRNQIRLILKTANGASIFGELDLKSLYNRTDIIFSGGYYPSANGVTVNGVSYRIFQQNPNTSDCDADYKIQKLINGTWTNLSFNLDYYGLDGNFVSTNSSHTSIAKINAIWDGSSENLPNWKCGVYPLCESSDLPGNYFFRFNSEFIELDFLMADSSTTQLNTNNSIVCWGNPLAYYHGYNKDEYLAYGVPNSAITGFTSDLQNLNAHVSQKSVDPSFASVQNTPITQHWSFQNNCLYTGRLSLAQAISGNTLTAPLTESPTYKLYVGPATAYPIPVNKSVGGLHTPMVVRLNQLANANPEACIINSPLPVGGYSNGTPQIQGYYVGYGSPLDVEFTNKFGVAQQAVKCLNVNSAADLQSTYNSKYKWIVLSEQDPDLVQYQWSKSPTGYWYVYNNNSDSQNGSIPELESRYYNLTGMYVPTPVADLESQYKVKLPFDLDISGNPRELTLAQLTAMGLGIRRFYIVKHHTNRFVNTTYNLRSIGAGKHFSIIPAGGVSVAITASRYGLNIEADDGVLNNVNINEDENNIWSSWIPHANVNLGFNPLGLFVGYRSLYALNKSELSVFANSSNFSYLRGFSQGNNYKGQLSTSDYYSAFVVGNPFHTPTTTSRTYHPSWFMDVGQKNLPSSTSAPGLNFTKISCGQYHALAIDQFGKVHGWGTGYAIHPAVQTSTEWIPNSCYTLPSGDDPCISPFVFYGAKTDSINTDANRPLWPSNYVGPSYSGSAPAALDAYSVTSFGLPYSNINSHYVSGGTVRLENTGSIFEIYQKGSVVSDYRNGGFKLRLLQTNAGYVFEAGTDINEPKVYSDPIDQDSFKLISWGYSYSTLNNNSLKLLAKINGRNVLWNGTFLSSTVSSRDPLTTLIGVGDDNPITDSMFNLDSAAMTSALLEYPAEIKPIAGKTFAGFIVKSPTLNRPDAKRLIRTPPIVGVIQDPLENPFEDIAVGSINSADWVVYKLKRSFRVTGPIPPAGIYAGASPAIANKSDNYKIYVGENTFNAGSDTATETVDYNTSYDDFAFTPGWPKVVFPGDTNYDSPGSFNPQEIGLCRLPNKLYSSSNHFDLVKLRNLKFSPEPTIESFDVDFVSMQRLDDPLSEIVVYDSVTKKVLPQYYTPTEQQIPTSCFDVAASQRTSFAVSPSKIYSWGQSYFKSRAYNLSNYDKYSITLPSGGLTSLSTPARFDVPFRGAGLSAIGGIQLWGSGTGYTIYHPDLDEGFRRIWPAAGNNIWYSYSIDNPALNSLVSGFKKIAVADWASSHPNSQNNSSARSEFYVGIDANNKIKTFKVVFESLGIPEGQFSEIGYLKYKDDSSIWFSNFGYYDFSVPAEIANEDFKDIQIGYDCVVALTIDGRVYCWGPGVSQGLSNNIVWNFDSTCHECANSNSDPIDPNSSRPSAKTKLNSNHTTNPAIDIAVSANHAAVLRQDGSVLVWGKNTQYSSSTIYSEPQQKNNPFKVATVSNKPVKLGSCANFFVGLKSDGIAQTWGPSGDAFNTLQNVNLGGFQLAKISKNPAADHFVALKNDGTVTAWGAGKIGEFGIGNFGQSAVPNLTNRQAAVVNLSEANVNTAYRMLVSSIDGVIAQPVKPPDSIRADLPDNSAVLENDIAHLTNVVYVAAGQRVGIAIVNSNINATAGSLLQWGSGNPTTAPSGNNWIKAACSNGPEWSHAAALNSSNELTMWGLDSYWTSTIPEGSFTDIKCSNDAVIALRSNGKIAVYSPNIQSPVLLPTYLQNVSFSSISAGANHVVAIVSAGITQTTPQGEFVLNSGDVVAWGLNDKNQCNIPGYEYASSNNLPIQSVAATAGYNTSFVYRLPTSIAFNSSGVEAAAFFRSGQQNMELAEGYMTHSIGLLCDSVLPFDHSFSINPPEKSLGELQINDGSSVGVLRGHSTNAKISSRALNIPSYLRPNSNSPRRAKLVTAGRFAGYLRRASQLNTNSIGYSVIVEEGSTDTVHVIGGEYLPTGCQQPIANAASIAIRQIPSSLFEEDTQLVSLQSHRGYIYALDAQGVIHSWGYDEGNPDYFSVNSFLKKNLSIPATSINDNNVVYLSNSSPNSLAASYVTGVPGFTSSWSMEVGLNRVLNGQKTSIRKFVATGSTDKVSISTPRYFAQGFVAMDTWPEAGSSLDTYYALELRFTGGGIRYQVHSASLAAINLDSRTSASQRIMIEATPNSSGPIPDFAVINNSTFEIAPNFIESRTPVAFNSVNETNAGFLVNYTSDSDYPVHLRNSYGGSSRVENINTASRNLLLQGRIASLESNISNMSADRIWTHTGINPINGSNNANVISWAGAIPNTPFLNMPTPALNSTIVTSFTSGTRAVKLPGETSSTASGLAQLNPNLLTSTFTYFVVKKNTYDSASGASYNPHSIFTACDRRLKNNITYVQGLGERGRRPAIIVTFDGVTLFAESSIQSITVGTPQIVVAYLGESQSIWNPDPNNIGVRVDGVQQPLALPDNAVTTAPLNSGYYLGVPTINAETGLREKNTEYAEVIAFDRLLSLADIQFVEGYLAWRYGIQSNLPAGHPYKNTQPTRGQLDALRPLNYDSDPLQSIDIGVAAREAPETWLTLYDVGVEYTSKRLTSTGSILDDHAPLVVELELNQLSTQGLISTNIAGKLLTNLPELDVERSGFLPSGRSFGRSFGVVVDSDSFYVLRNTNFNSTQFAAKLKVTGRLNVITALSPLEVFGKLKFWRGTNCGPIYGCESYEEGDPNLEIIRPDNPLEGLTFSKLYVLPSLLTVNNRFRYLNINAKLNINSPNLTGPLPINAQSIAAVAKINEPVLRDFYTEIAAVDGGIVACKCVARVCEGTGFIVLTPKYKPNLSLGIFPNSVKISKLDINDTFFF